MANTLPHEIKRLIFDHADLETAKALRLVSSSWAVVGLDILFLHTFVIKSYPTDLQRLINIGNNHNTAVQAAKIINTLEFRDKEYDPTMVRTIFCSRHVQVASFQKTDFVPNQFENASLDEIDTVIAQRDQDDSFMNEKGETFLIEAFRNVPRVETIKFTHPNPFEQPLLKKVWAEYDFQLYDHRPVPKCLQLSSILSALKHSGMRIKHFTHGRYNSNLFSPTTGLRLSQYLTELRSLNLSIFDLNNIHPDLEDQETGVGATIQNILLVNPALEELRMSFDCVERPHINSLPTISSSHLKTLALRSIAIRATDLLSFLSANAATLQRVSISHAEMIDSDSTWKDFLEQMRANSDFALEKFQLSGLVRSMSETWLLWPIYDAEWKEYENLDWAKVRGVEGTSHLTRALEGFVMRSGEWPRESLEISPELGLT
ncbi:uncharacterized protein LY89DRAFT_681667 [Mollisia scopiformis]|uniref:F-box domain-containing protein n=1 Tax=Mollisia scopiformis TaxID=149040 RepID=A0A194XLN0_MOLSC|nr:uncharacterized protein LY89DRAFT_681667 [Mollisia scopiformis]KUJ21041.1 hypothetical protein LY89DRAFT_681667 [Mollisia scopiformis]